MIVLSFAIICLSDGPPPRMMNLLPPQPAGNTTVQIPGTYVICKTHDTTLSL